MASSLPTDDVLLDELQFDLHVPAGLDRQRVEEIRATAEAELDDVKTRLEARFAELRVVRAVG
jgi:hypothetical protein